MHYGVIMMTVNCFCPPLQLIKTLEYKLVHLELLLVILVEKIII